ncbi:MAG: HAMP domain-containing sensor histidine kinase, partial [Desulfobacterales bacterium]
LIAGFLVWLYTLVLPSLTDAGILPQAFIQEGPWSLEYLKPFQLFGLRRFDQISHGVFWSLLFNTVAYVGVSLFSRPSALEHTQATMFVDVFRFSGDSDETPLWRGTARIPDLKSLLERFLGVTRTAEVLAQYARQHAIDWDQSLSADPGFVTYVEKLLAGAVGSASARVVVASVVKEEPLGIREVMGILDETRQVITYSRQLEEASAELRAANERLKELDRLKDDFLSTVSHELRTPLTAIQSLAEILRDYPNTEEPQKQKFLEIMIKEIQRLARLINQVLNFQKIESGRMQWQIGSVDLRKVIEDAVAASSQLVDNKQLRLQLDLPDAVPAIIGDRDQLMQAMVNLISNAVKFCEEKTGVIIIALAHRKNTLRVSVRDNGVGISAADQKVIFEQFRQVSTAGRGRPPGSGLGLTITRRIIEFHGGRITVESKPGRGSTFTFEIPLQTPLAAQAGR